MGSSRESWKVEKGVFDNFTIQNLRKLESDGFLNIEALSPLFLGKEANVFTSPSKHGQVIVKIYRLENADFLKMFSYLQGDTRINKLKRARRDIIFTWVRREHRNLMSAREAKVRCPLPLALKHNVLVMELIGDPANKVKDTLPKDPSAYYSLVIKEMRKLLRAGMVHGDLSQFNILNEKEKPIFIDFSQSTVIEAPQAKEYLERDLKNVNTFFSKIGVKEKELKTLKDLL